VIVYPAFIYLKYFENKLSLETIFLKSRAIVWPNAREAGCERRIRKAKNFNQNPKGNLKSLLFIE